MSETTRPCYVCGGTMAEGRATVSYLETAEPFVVEQVPALICDRCGEQAYSAPVLTVLERLIEEGGAPCRVLSVPVYDFAAAGHGAKARLTS